MFGLLVILLCFTPIARATFEEFSSAFTAANPGLTTTAFINPLIILNDPKNELNFITWVDSEIPTEGLERALQLVYTYINPASTEPQKFSEEQKKVLLSGLSLSIFTAKIYSFLDLNLAVKAIYGDFIHMSKLTRTADSFSILVFNFLKKSLRSLKDLFFGSDLVFIDEKIDYLNKMFKVFPGSEYESVFMDYYWKRIFNNSNKEFDDLAKTKNVLLVTSPLTPIMDIEDQLNALEDEYIQYQNELIDTINSISEFSEFKTVTFSKLCKPVATQFTKGYAYKVQALNNLINGKFKSLVNKVKPLETSGTVPIMSDIRADASEIAIESERILIDLYGTLPDLPLKRSKKYKISPVVAERLVTINKFYLKVLDLDSLMIGSTESNGKIEIRTMSKDDLAKVASASAAIANYISTDKKLAALHAKAINLKDAALVTMNTAQNYNEYRKALKQFYESINPTFKSAYRDFNLEKELGIVVDLKYEVDEDFKKYVTQSNKIVNAINALQEPVPDIDDLIISIKREIRELIAFLNNTRTFSSTALNVGDDSVMAKLNRLHSDHATPLYNLVKADDVAGFQKLKSDAKIQLKAMMDAYGLLYTTEPTLLENKPTTAEYITNEIDTLAHSAYKLFSNLLSIVVFDLNDLTGAGHHAVNPRMKTNILKMENVIITAGSTYGIETTAFSDFMKANGCLGIFFAKAKSVIDLTYQTTEQIDMLREIIKKFPLDKILKAFRGSENFSAIVIESVNYEIPLHRTPQKIYESIQVTSVTLVDIAKIYNPINATISTKQKQIIQYLITFFIKTLNVDDFTAISGVDASMVAAVTLEEDNKLIADVKTSLEHPFVKKNFITAVKALVDYLSIKWGAIASKFPESPESLVKPFPVITKEDIDKSYEFLTNKHKMHYYTIAKSVQCIRIDELIYLEDSVNLLLIEINNAQTSLDLPITTNFLKIIEAASSLKAAKDVTAANGFLETLIINLEEYRDIMFLRYDKPINSNRIAGTYLSESGEKRKKLERLRLDFEIILCEVLLLTDIKSGMEKAKALKVELLNFQKKVRDITVLEEPITDTINELNLFIIAPNVNKLAKFKRQSKEIIRHLDTYALTLYEGWKKSDFTASAEKSADKLSYRSNYEKVDSHQVENRTIQIISLIIIFGVVLAFVIGGIVYFRRIRRRRPDVENRWIAKSSET